MVERWLGRPLQPDLNNQFNQGNQQPHQQGEVITDHNAAQKDAENAQAVLDNPIFIRAISEIKQSILDAWQSTGPDAQEDREKLFKYLLAVNMLDRKLKSFIAKFHYESSKPAAQELIKQSII